MTNALSAARVAAKTALENAELRAFTIVPERLSPPAVWVAPGDPYVTFDGATLGGGRNVNLSLVAVVPSGTNDQQADALDALILRVCDAVEDSDDLYLGDVGQPGQVAINGQSHLACAIAVTCEIHHQRSTP